MTASLRVLSYNVQFRSWGMEAGAQGSLTPYTNVEERAETIAKRILASPQDYDILCFMEVFDEDGRDVLFEKLKGKYPHVIRKSDEGGIDFLTVSATGVAINALMSLNLIGLLASGSAAGLLLAETIFEDSGLMLFSRLPFAKVEPQQAFVNEAAQHGVSVPATVPITEFAVYRDTAGEDEFAAKGVLYVQIPVEGRSLHLMLTHAQADSWDTQGHFHGTRRLQLGQAYELLTEHAGDPREAEVLFVGDFNIDGTKRGPGTEWTARFDTPGSPYTDVLQDAWLYDQVPGIAGPGRILLRGAIDPGITAHRQRLDYAIRSRGPSQNRLLLQHMAIAYEIANDAASPTVYTSDHLPLRIDLREEEPHASVLTAKAVPVTRDAPDQTMSGVLDGTQMHWFRVDEPGGYRIGISRGDPKVRVQVYTVDNLSVPVRPFMTLDDTAGRSPLLRYALPQAPFYLRVFRTARTGRDLFDLSVHRYAGTGPDEAIPLPRLVTVTEFAKRNAQHSDDRADTRFNDHDTIWFVAPFDTEPDGSLQVTSTVTITSDSGAFGGLVVGRKHQAAFEEMGEADAGPEVVMTVQYSDPKTGYVVVRRTDPTFQAQEFTVRLSSDVSYLYGNVNNPRSRARQMARLFCHDETDGFAGSEAGSDDIQINVTADGVNRVHIPGSEQLKFEDESMRDLPQVDCVRYRNSAKFELVELDDLSAVDRASVLIPQFSAFPPGDKRVVESSASDAIVVSRVVFESDDGDEDGVYDFQVTVSAEPPVQV